MALSRRARESIAQVSPFYMELVDPCRAASYPRLMRRIALLACFFLFPVLAASPEPRREMSVAEAIVFKNGLAFMTREGTLSFRDGEALVVAAPEALLGTLWINAGVARSMSFAP